MLRWWLLILWGGSLFAQNSGMVRAAAQAYHAQRDTAPLSALQLREADRLDQEAQQEAQAGGYGEALRRYAHAGAILRNAPWTPAIEFASSLEVRVDHFMLEPGKPVAVSLGALYPTATTGSEKLIASVFLTAAGPGGPPERALAQGALLEPMRIPFATRITMPETEAGNYNLEVRLKLPDSSVPADAVFTKRLPVHVENLSGEAQKLRAHLARISRSKSPALPSAQYALQFYERVDRGEEGSRRYGRYPFREELERAGALLDDLEAGRDPFGAKPGDFHRAYRSAVDQTLQPYRLFVPEGYDGSRPAPLLIALHGSGGDENDFFDRYQEAPLKPEAQRVGFIVVCPKGREANSGYRGPAERDVFDVLAEAERDYRIDPARIYVMGHSMGAFAAWRLAVEHPGRFAALGLSPAGANRKTWSRSATSRNTWCMAPTTIPCPSRNPERWWKQAGKRGHPSSMWKSSALAITRRRWDNSSPCWTSLPGRRKRSHKLKLVLMIRNSMRPALQWGALMMAAAALAWGQQSPPAQASVTVAGKKLIIRYSAPSVRGRQIFGDRGLLSRDPTYPAWRAGANSATSFHTDADLDIGGLSVPKGDYTLYCWVKNPDAWELIINRETGQWGLSYDAKRDVGRVKMAMSKPPAPVEMMKFTLSDQGANKVKLQLEWENHVASVPVTVK